MVAIEHSENSAVTIIILKQNVSADFAWNIRSLTPLFILIATIAVFFSFLGAWMILPFAGLEVVCVVFAFYFWFRYCIPMEVIRISDAEIILEKGRSQLEQQWHCQRFWVKLRVYPHAGWYLPKVTLQCQQMEIEIGKFLNKEDKQLLIQELRQQFMTL